MGDEDKRLVIAVAAMQSLIRSFKKVRTDEEAAYIAKRSFEMADEMIRAEKIKTV